MTSKIPLFSLSDKTTAPAPSPNKTHVDLSFQSIDFDKVSAPITKAFFILFETIIDFATLIPYINPEHAAPKSNANAFFAPIFF